MFRTHSFAIQWIAMASLTVELRHHVLWNQMKFWNVCCMMCEETMVNDASDHQGANNFRSFHFHIQNQRGFFSNSAVNHACLPFRSRLDAQLLYSI